MRFSVFSLLFSFLLFALLSLQIGGIITYLYSWYLCLISATIGIFVPYLCYNKCCVSLSSHRRALLPVVPRVVCISLTLSCCFVCAPYICPSWVPGTYYLVRLYVFRLSKQQQQDFWFISLRRVYSVFFLRFLIVIMLAIWRCYVFFVFSSSCCRCVLAPRVYTLTFRFFCVAHEISLRFRQTLSLRRQARGPNPRPSGVRARHGFASGQRAEWSSCLSVSYDNIQPNEDANERLYLPVYTTATLPPPWIKINCVVFGSFAAKMPTHI